MRWHVEIEVELLTTYFTKLIKAFGIIIKEWSHMSLLGYFLHFFHLKFIVNQWAAIVSHNALFFFFYILSLLFFVFSPVNHNFFSLYSSNKSHSYILPKKVATKNGKLFIAPFVVSCVLGFIVMWFPWVIMGLSYSFFIW